MFRQINTLTGDFASDMGVFNIRGAHDPVCQLTI
jgi:hypothetical protein